MSKKVKKQSKKSSGKVAWAISSVLLAGLMTTATILVNGEFRPILTTVLGGEMPITDPSIEKIYHSDYESKIASKEAGDALNVQIAEEGFTLLLNEDNALPIATPESVEDAAAERPRVSVFGKNSVNLVLGGSGSGGISGDSAATIYDGLEAGGFEVNPTLKAFYEDKNASGEGRGANPTLSEASTSAPTLPIGETPYNSYTDEVLDSLYDYNDVAFVVISRIGGESFDLPRFQNLDEGGIEENHYLQLNQNEYDMLDVATSEFEKVIVVLNTLTSFQCDFIDQYNNTAGDKRIDAVLWIGGPGTTGAKAVGDVLNGNVNPSGRTVDLYSKDFRLDPTWQNFGDNRQVNDGKDGAAFLQSGSAVQGQSVLAYEEGVYMGYRYYETRGFEEVQDDPNSNWYEENVRFPYGYGLSYTEFDQEIVSVNGSIKTGLTFEVKSTNVGDVAGKDVIELYVTLPYYEGGIEKSHVQLVDFAKTTVLAPNESYTATFKVSAYDLASYDYNDANSNDFCGYETEAGTYTFYASANSHVVENAYDEVEVELSEDMTFENDPVTGVKVENRYTAEGEELDFWASDYRMDSFAILNTKGEEVSRKGMSRTDFDYTMPTPFTAAEREFLTDANDQSEFDFLKNDSHNNTLVAETVAANGMPTTNPSSSEITIRDLRGAEYNDPRWEQLLDRLTVAEMKDLVNNGAFQTVAIESIDKNLTNDSDGPIGFVNFMPGKSESYKGNTTFACEIVIGSTWNKDLAYQMGKIVGENGLWGDVEGNGLPYSGWYAPAVNLHRSPFSGRNFEYYSEDPVFSGKMAVNVINGAATKGVYTDLKHFALNDQETNRAGVSTFCTEQALRELYLKPFEIAVKGLDNPAEVATAAEDGITEFVGTMGIMSSFNRIGARWTGGDYRLLTEILRNEWGFEGLVICDYKSDNAFMHSKQMLYAGNDLILASLENLMWTNPDASNAEDVTILRQASHNILYVVANSNSLNVKITGYMTEWWLIAVYALDAIVALLILVWGFRVFTKKADKKADKKAKKANKKDKKNDKASEQEEVPSNPSNVKVVYVSAEEMKAKQAEAEAQAVPANVNIVYVKSEKSEEK